MLLSSAYLALQVVGSSSDTKLLARSSSQHALRPPITQLQAPGVGGERVHGRPRGLGPHLAERGEPGRTGVIGWWWGHVRLFPRTRVDMC